MHENLFAICRITRKIMFTVSFGKKLDRQKKEARRKRAYRETVNPSCVQRVFIYINSKGQPTDSQFARRLFELNINRCIRVNRSNCLHHHTTTNGSCERWTENFDPRTLQPTVLPCTTSQKSLQIKQFLFYSLYFSCFYNLHSVFKSDNPPKSACSVSGVSSVSIAIDRSITGRFLVYLLR